MAYTVTAPVGNDIELAASFLPMLDEIYTSESKTAILDTVSDRIQFVGANTVNLFTLDPVGMGNYNRNSGYPAGDVVGEWVPYTLETERGRSYMVDVLDNEESKGLAFGGLLSTVEREFIIPEIDAFRFAAYADGAAADNVKSEAISAAADAVAAIDEATVTLDEAEVPYAGRILFVNPQTYGFIKAGITRFVENGDRNINFNVDYYNDMRVITVPSKRFNTEITLNSVSDTDDVGGYTASGATINFMIVHPSAIMQVMKHYAPRIFSPAVNQEADAFKLNIRYTHGAWVKSNKTNGIYVHAGTTTSA